MSRSLWTAQNVLAICLVTGAAPPKLLGAGREPGRHGLYDMASVPCTGLSSLRSSRYAGKGRFSRTRTCHGSGRLRRLGPRSEQNGDGAAFSCRGHRSHGASTDSRDGGQTTLWLARRRHRRPPRPSSLQVQLLLALPPLRAGGRLRPRPCRRSLNGPPPQPGSRARPNQLPRRRHGRSWTCGQPTSGPRRWKRPARPQWPPFSPTPTLRPACSTGVAAAPQVTRPRTAFSVMATTCCRSP